MIDTTTPRGIEEYGRYIRLRLIETPEPIFLKIDLELEERRARIREFNEREDK